nr:ShlB/FhaC/HecB family hemolysin secretion/activation protein [uncultured Roseateles sp.]
MNNWNRCVSHSQRYDLNCSPGLGLECAVSIALALSTAAPAALAQTPPIPAPATTPATVDPAQLQRQREELERLRQLQAPKPVDPKLSAPSPEPEGPIAAGPSFVLKQVEFTPSQLLSKAELDGVIATQLGKPTTFADVKRLAQDINSLYLAKGHLTARAFVPSQRVAEGLLRVQLIEAKLSRLDAADNSRLSPAFVASLIATPEGSLIDAPAIDERLTRLHRNTPDNRIGLSFSAAEGNRSGLSVLKVQTEEPPLWTARVSASNEGADSLGKNQGSLNLSVNNLLGWTDKLSVLAIYSTGSTSANLQYSVPLPGPFLAWGTRLSAGASKGKTLSISPGFESVKLDGQSDGANLALAQPLWSSGAWSVDGMLSLGNTRSATDIAAERFSDIRTRSNGLSFTVARNAEGSSASLGLAYNHARTSAQGVEARENGVIQLNFSLQQVIGAGFWGLSRAVLQRSGDDRLPSTLQFQIGGPGNVRGYPSPSVSGDIGESLTLELHRAVTPVSERLDGYAFVDAGRVRTLGVGNSLASVGLGLSYTADAWGASLAVASPRKDVPNVSKDSSRVLLRFSLDLDKFLN